MATTTSSLNNYPFYFSWCAQKDAAPLHVERVEDFCFYAHGKRYIDLSAVSFHASFGLNPRSIILASQKALEHTPILPARAVTDFKSNVTKRLLDYLRLPAGGKIFYTVSGAESVENALKMAREFTQRKIVLARQESYHGASLGALMATGDWRHDAHQTPNDWTVRIPSPLDDPDASELEKIINKLDGKNIAAIILETAPASNGVSFGSPQWWKKVRSLCDQHGMMLIADEVVCGFHRLGTPLGIHHFGVTPDFVCLAKAISGGVLPLGAVWTSSRIATFYQDHMLSCGLTQYAFQAGLGALDGVLDIVTSSSFQEHYQAQEKVFHQYLERWKTFKNVKTVRVIGMLACVERHQPFRPSELNNAGLLCYMKNERLILCPALNFSLPLLEEALTALENLLH